MKKTDKYIGRKCEVVMTPPSTPHSGHGWPVGTKIRILTKAGNGRSNAYTAEEWTSTGDSYVRTINPKEFTLCGITKGDVQEDIARLEGELETAKQKLSVFTEMKQKEISPSTLDAYAALRSALDEKLTQAEKVKAIERIYAE